MRRLLIGAVVAALGATAMLTFVALAGARPADTVRVLQDPRPEFVFIVIGDSFTAGEGNPERAGGHNNLGALLPGRQAEFWGSDADGQRCHRSGNAGPALAAQELERKFPQIRIIFRSFACSGAKIRQYATWSDGKAEGPNHGGLLDPYRGVDPCCRSESPLAPQVEQVNDFLQDTERTRIDALLMAIGINDIGFSKIVERCIVRNCVSSLETRATRCSSIINRGRTGCMLRVGLGRLPSAYRMLATAIAGASPGGGRPALARRPGKVYLSEYPDPTHDERGAFCHRKPALWDPIGHLTRTEAAWMYHNALGRPGRPGLNTEVRRAARMHGWEHVRFPLAVMRRHGVCAAANARWLNNGRDALRKQGADALDGPAASAPFSTGMLHPNARGHAEWAKLIVAALEPQIRLRFGIETARVSRTAPSAPTDLRATSASPFRLILRWSDRSSNETQFQLDVAGDALRLLGANATQYVHHASGQFFYRVRACRGTPVAMPNVGAAATDCSTWSPTLRASNLDPIRPVDLRRVQAEVTIPGILPLRWTPVVDSWAWFDLEHREVFGLRNAAPVWVPRSLTDPSFLLDLRRAFVKPLRHEFRVRACTNVGCSPWTATLRIRN